MIFHKNYLLADDSHEISYFFLKKIEKDVVKCVVCCSRDLRFKSEVNIIKYLFIDKSQVAENLNRGIRTSDSLNEGLPIEMTREKFQRKQYFSMKKIVGSTLDLSTKAVFFI